MVSSGQLEDRKQLIDGSLRHGWSTLPSLFLHPQLTFHRRYEGLRAFFVDDRPVAEIAVQFGYKPTALSVMISRFHAQFRRGSVPPFFVPDGRGRPPGQRLMWLRPDRAGRTAHRGQAALEPPLRSVGCTHANAGVFLFLPPRAKLRVDRIVTQADYPGTKMVPASTVLLAR